MSAVTARQALIRRLEERDQPLLEEMYERFLPHGEVMGLPPHDAARRREWLIQLRAGVNLVALVDGTLAGHLALMPDGNRGELIVFVRKDFRRQGIAKAMVRQALEEARAMGLKALWVLIDSLNGAAYRGLAKFGFHSVGQTFREVEMVYQL